MHSIVAEYTRSAAVAIHLVSVSHVSRVDHVSWIYAPTHGIRIAGRRVSRESIVRNDLIDTLEGFSRLYCRYARVALYKVHLHIRLEFVICRNFLLNFNTKLRFNKKMKT